MSAPHLTAAALRTPENPTRLVVLGPGLGTTVTSSWWRVLPELPESWRVVGVDLPGHGESAPWTGPPDEPAMADLACSVVEAVLHEMDQDPRLQELPVHFAGISLAGGIALQLALHHAKTFSSVASICSGPRFGSAQTWLERAASVRSGGTAQLREGSRQRWFTPDFIEAQSSAVASALESLEQADDESYALLCETLADFDLTDRLQELAAPALVLSGALDVVSPPEVGRLVEESSESAVQHVIESTAHQAPLEKPTAVAAHLRAFFDPS